MDKVAQVASDIVDAPVKFANNLMDGIGQGFSQFFDNIGKHLLVGLLEWLLSGLKEENITVEMPKELSLSAASSVFFLQLLGISWARHSQASCRATRREDGRHHREDRRVIDTLATRASAASSRTSRR